MTEEEIKNLKAGDKFTVEYTVTNAVSLPLGIGVKIRHLGHTWVDKMSKIGNQLKTATLVKPAPVFEAGDKVRIIPDPMTGTVHNSYGQQCEVEGLIVRLSWLNKSAGQVMFKSKGKETEVSIHCIELVKKAVGDKFDVCRCVGSDEQEDGWAVYYKGTLDKIAYFADSHPDAKAAAKAECDRLNAEWRAQQEGGRHE